MQIVNYYGLLFGVIAFLIIGIFHPVVAKTEYYFGKKIWGIFLVLGIVFCGFSLISNSVYWSIVLGTLGFSLFWSTHELFKQHNRVLLGRAKRNPNRIYENFAGAIFLQVFSLNINCTGIIVGAATFVIIAGSRYFCIKAEYYFSKKFWIAFFLIGIVSVTGSLFVPNLVVSVILGINGFAFLWGIGEIMEQEKRVQKGWFPKRNG